ncbi:hypothetical protein GCM10020254_12260 [Streptomyces goshikiensis]
MPSATTNRNSTSGSVKFTPGRSSRFWETSAEAPRVAAKPSPTETIRTSGASRLRRSRSRISEMSPAATGKTTLRSSETAEEMSAKSAAVPPTWTSVPSGRCAATVSRTGPETRSRAC